MKRLFNKITLIFTFVALSNIATSHDVLAHDETSVRIFYSYESNGADYISAIGVGTNFFQNTSHFGAQLNTSLGYAEVLATDGYLKEYVAWEASVKMGYFSTISFYIEGGVDLSELLFHDLRYDHEEEHYCYDDEYCYEDYLDAFFGIGAGLQAGTFGIEAFVRARQIDSKYWEANSEIFSGIQISVNF